MPVEQPGPYGQVDPTSGAGYASGPGDPSGGAPGRNAQPATEVPDRAPPQGCPAHTSPWPSYASDPRAQFGLGLTEQLASAATMQQFTTMVAAAAAAGAMMALQNSAHAPSSPGVQQAKFMAAANAAAMAAANRAVEIMPSATAWYMRSQPGRLACVGLPEASTLGPGAPNGILPQNVPRFGLAPGLGGPLGMGMPMAAAAAAPDAAAMHAQSAAAQRNGGSLAAAAVLDQATATMPPTSGPSPWEWAQAGTHVQGHAFVAAGAPATARLTPVEEELVRRIQMHAYMVRAPCQLACRGVWLCRYPAASSWLPGRAGILPFVR
jgi:hypothetical protein